MSLDAFGLVGTALAPAQAASPPPDELAAFQAAQLDWHGLDLPPLWQPVQFAGTCPRKSCRGAQLRSCCGTRSNHDGCDRTRTVEIDGEVRSAHWFQSCQCGYSRLACGAFRFPVLRRAHARRVAQRGRDALLAAIPLDAGLAAIDRSGL